MTTAHETGSTVQWVPPPPEAAERAERLLALEPRLHPALARILAVRDLTDVDAVRAFLRPTLDALHDPFALPDMERAVERVLAAVDAGETIFVHGDFDADGMCAAALAVRCLRRLGARVVPFVPTREDGYDLRPDSVARAAGAGARVILTVDCGVTALEAVAEANQRGIDVVVTDHHRPGPELPAARAVVDPVREDSAYPFPGLAGVGVAFKLMAALFARRGVPEPELFQHLDLVAVGTIADRMPLVDENRILVRTGLRALERTRKPGLRALLRRSDVDPLHPIDAEDVSFRLAPRLNAVGRMAAAEAGVRLLVTDDPAAAEELAAHLDEQNLARKRTDREVTADVERALAERFDASAHGAVVVWGDDWHRGVVGLVASRMVERWARPAVVVSFDGDVGEGSGRSVEGFHLYEALRRCESLLEGFGGHRMAAGLRIRRERIEEFAARLRELAAERTESPASSGLRIDLEVPLADVTFELADTLRHLAPHGEANPAPVLAVRGVEIDRAEAIGREGRHLRAELRDGSDGVRAVGFGLGERAAELGSGGRVDAAFRLEQDVWRGRKRLQARLLDVRPVTS